MYEKRFKPDNCDSGILDMSKDECKEEYKEYCKDNDTQLTTKLNNLNTTIRNTMGSENLIPITGNLADMLHNLMKCIEMIIIQVRIKKNKSYVPIYFMKNGQLYILHTDNLCDINDAYAKETERPNFPVELRRYR